MQEELYETRHLWIVSVNGKQELDYETVVRPQDEISLIPIISGGSDDSYFILKRKTCIEVGNAYTQEEEDRHKRQDDLAIKLDRYNFMSELEKYNKYKIDIKKLLESENCMKCNKKLHIPDAWRNMSLVARRAYFKYLVQKGQKEGIIYCCNCYYEMTNVE